MARWEAVLEELVTRRHRALVGYAYLLCGDARQAEDLLQDALVKVFARLRTPAPPTAHATAHPLVDGADTRGGPTLTEAYVRRTILTLYLDSWRRQRRWRQVVPLVASAETGRGPESGATARADVAAALARLAPRERAAVVLRYFEDLTVPQVADAMGLAPGTVKRYLSDATVTLRAVLSVPDDAAAPTTAAGTNATETTDGRRAGR
ncbi:RNA polymerase sigma factor [Xylanimonas ulmi]|uniref:RNA polymerase sigma-70 factor (ECF subfamily) n=1 Tax=Xylanimonas ulmi TaxID=228973 RepID=A0A4Q7M4P8_9MICO|nr:sigma-70 family RNA polymerase sigma factor [Xylanibacterium ulmi]RZS62926.1 RNA polymerase sigma-70 factor (ECF subfamily) [Xylanibacterium ulmi]